MSRQLAEVRPLAVFRDDGNRIFGTGLKQHQIDYAEAVHGDRDLVAADAAGSRMA